MWRGTCHHCGGVQTIQSQLQTPPLVPAWLLHLLPRQLMLGQTTMPGIAATQGQAVAAAAGSVVGDVGRLLHRPLLHRLLLRRMLLRWLRRLLRRLLLRRLLCRLRRLGEVLHTPLRLGLCRVCLRCARLRARQAGVHVHHPSRGSEPVAQHQDIVQPGI